MTKKEAEVLRFALVKMKEFDLTGQGWRFKFDHARSRYGVCDYSKKIISLSRYLVELNPIEDSFDTVLHEIAHALVGAGVGHSDKWRKVAISIGCNGERYHNSATVERKHIGVCVHCSKVFRRHRKRRIACGRCCELFNNGVFSEAYLIKWN